MVGRYPEAARSELRVERGVTVLGMQCEGLDSEYTVTSSSSYLNSLEVKAGNLEVWRFPGIGFSSCAAPTFSRVQGILYGGHESSSGTHQNGVECWNDSEYEYKGERSGGSEFV